MIALSPVLSPSSIFPLPSCHCSLFPANENLVHVYKMSLVQIFVVFKLSISEFA
jgi:hypothetical protein